MKYWMLFLLPLSVSFALMHRIYGPRITGNSSGNAVIIWSGTKGSYFNIYEATLPSGGSWSTPTRITSNDNDSFYPSVALDDSGDAIFLFTHYSSQSFKAEASTASFGGTPTTPQRLSSCDSRRTKVVTSTSSSDGNAAVWQESTSAGYRLTMAFDIGSSDQTVVEQPVTSLNTPLAPDIAMDRSSGNVLVVWQGSENGNSAIQAVEIPKGKHWGTPTTLSDTSVPATTPVVAYSSSGEALVAWQATVGGSLVVQVVSYQNGSWGTVQTFSNSNAYLYKPALAINASGQVILTGESLAGTTKSIFAVTRTAEKVWGSLTTISSSGAAQPSSPYAVIGGSGKGAVFWEESPTSKRVIQAATFISSVWSTPVTVSAQETLAINSTAWVNDVNQSIIAAWEKSQTGHPDIESSTFSFTTQQWSAPSTISVLE